MAERLAPKFRVILPDLPLGSHRTPMKPDAGLSPPRVASLVGELIERTEARGVTLVGNDSGGAISQMLVTTDPTGIDRLVLTNCDAFDKFPPGHFGPMFRAARYAPVLWLIAQSMRPRMLARSPLAFGMLSKTRIPDELIDRWTRPSLESAEIRRDFRTLLKGLSPDQTMEAARKLPEFDRPTLFAWGADDKLFKLDFAERLAAPMKDARVVPIDDASTFVMLDQPDRLAKEIAAFASS